MYEKPAIFLAHTFGARDAFTVVLLRRCAKNDRSRRNAIDTLSVFECFFEWRSLTRLYRWKLSGFSIVYMEKP